MTSRADETERVVMNPKIKDALLQIDFIKRYDELEDILTISFRMYEDFKKACCKAS